MMSLFILAQLHALSLALKSSQFSYNIYLSLLQKKIQQIAMIVPIQSYKHRTSKAPTI